MRVQGWWHRLDSSLRRRWQTYCFYTPSPVARVGFLLAFATVLVQVSVLAVQTIKHGLDWPPVFTLGQWILLGIMAISVATFTTWLDLYKHHVEDREEIRKRSNGYITADLQMASVPLRRDYIRFTGIVNPIVAGLCVLTDVPPQPWRGVVTTLALVWFPLRLCVETMLDKRGYNKSIELIDEEEAH